MESASEEEDLHWQCKNVACYKGACESHLSKQNVFRLATITNHFILIYSNFVSKRFCIYSNFVIT